MELIMTQEVQQSAQEFASDLEMTPIMIAFRAARKDFETNEDVLELRHRLSVLNEGYQRKQANNEVTQEDIALLRATQHALTNHPAVVHFSRTRQELLAMFRSCDETISEELGFAFAASAAPASCCG